MSKNESDDDLILSQDGFPHVENQPRGRARLRAEESEVSARILSSSAAESRLQSTQSGAYYRHSPTPQSRRRQKLYKDREPPVTVYQYTRAHNAPPQADKRQRSYERRSPAQYADEEYFPPRLSSSPESNVQDESSVATALGSRENSFKAPTSHSKESALVHAHEPGIRDERISSKYRQPNIFHSRSRNEPKSTTRSRVEEQSRARRYPGKHYTHYHGDWTLDEPYVAMKNRRQGSERSKHRQGYRRERVEDSELSSLKDKVSHVRSSMLVFPQDLGVMLTDIPCTPSINDLPSAPTPSLHLDQPWSAHEQPQGNFDDERLYSSRNGNKSQYQEAFGTEQGTTFFSEESMKPDSFYAAIQTVISSDIDDAEIVTKAETMKHVTFRNTEFG